MSYLQNPYRGRGLPADILLAEGEVRDDPRPVLALLAHCPVAETTPLKDVSELAKRLGIARLAVKDERSRMGLGSFKALGAAYAIARAAHDQLGDAVFDKANTSNALKGVVFTAATAGNHGLSVAAGAQAFGARAVIFIAETVPEEFADRLKSHGAEVVRAGKEYQASLDAAMQAADENGWILLSDTSWPGYTALPLDVMEGYLVMAAEAADQAEAEGWKPSHVFLQAGVGGLAAAVSAHLRMRWGDDFQIIVVEPDAAPALQASIEVGRPVMTSGPVSNMGRLDCKEPSHLALKCLARDADCFQTVSDDWVETAIADLVAEDLATSPSGGAGFAGLKAALKDGVGELDDTSRVLLFLSEGPTDG